ncbi:MAG TPA: patatin-like phospholipase family protein [Thermoanaerobaculia bacterium]|nr:patatin-like phospholipase family protein [Thermoanaerobaculia bacterium]
MRRTASALLAASLLAVSPLPAEEAPTTRPKIGVAFGGGGARGGAHVGVLKVLEELRIPVDYVAGTSIGSIVGGLYATGLSPAEMDDILRKTDWNDATSDDPPRKDVWYRNKEDDHLYLIKAELGLSHGKVVLPTGLLAGEKLGILLRKFTLPFSETRDFNAFPIPYRCVATDISNGSKVVLWHGDVARAMRASMAIPAFFTAVDIDGKLLTDGGTVENLPVQTVRDMGADIVIAINIGTPLKGKDQLTSFFAVANQLTGLLTVGNVQGSIDALRSKDLLIEPDLEGIESFNFEQFPEGIERGVAAAEAMKERLKALSVPEAEYAAFLKRQRYPHPVPRVDAVKVVPAAGVDPRVIASRVTYRPGGPVNWKAVDRTLADVYELGDFETVDFRIVPVNGVSTLVIEPRPKTPAPMRVRFGLLLNTDFSGSSAFALRASVNQTHLNALRGEWKTQFEVGNQNYLRTELYQPLDAAGRFFLAPSAGIQRTPFNLYVEQSAVGRYLVDDVFVGFDGGISLGPLGQVSAGIRRDWYKYKENISAFPVSDATQNQTAFVAQAVIDQMDNVAFPRDGWGTKVDFVSAGRVLGGDWSYNKLSFRGGWAHSWGSWTLALGANGAAKLGNNQLPFVEAAFAGGFLNLSGLQPLELWGNYGAVGRAVVYKRLIALPALVGSGVFLGGSLETGNAWLSSSDVRFDNLRFAGSVFLGADTLLGPLYFAFGLADGGQHSFYLALGLPLYLN